MEIRNADDYQRHRVALAEDQVARLEGKVATTEAHLDQAREALAAAQRELAEVNTSDPGWVEPTEHTSAHAQ